MMKKRLRKKLGVGEFQELGFEFFAELENADDQVLFDQFIALVENFDFYCEGSWDEDGADLFISTGLIDSDNENRKNQFTEKLSALTGLKNFKMTDLTEI